MHLLSLLVRCKNEPFIVEFVEHYLREGVDCIYIIDDNSSLAYSRSVLENKKVKIYWEKNIISNNMAHFIYQEIQPKSKWLIYVDADEFITSKKNSDKTIREELLSTFSEVDCIKIPWVMMSCNNRVKNPINLLKENIYRWNHDHKHLNNTSNIQKFRCRYDKIEVKCIFKTAKFNVIGDHHPKERQGEICCVDSVKANTSPLDPFYTNLRESDIKTAYLVCYHYRIVSIENAQSKIAENVWYADYTVKDLMSSDYPEVIDNTLKNKASNGLIKQLLTYLGIKT